MVRQTVVAAMLLALPSAHAFFDRIDAEDVAKAYMSQFEAPPNCKYTFGWGRNTVAITYEGHESTPIECTFTHSERVSNTPNSTNMINATYYQYYSCADGSWAVYSTNWIGSSFSFNHYPTHQDRRSCR